MTGQWDPARACPGTRADKRRCVVYHSSPYLKRRGRIGQADRTHYAKASTKSCGACPGGVTHSGNFRAERGEMRGSSPDSEMASSEAGSVRTGRTENPTRQIRARAAGWNGACGRFAFRRVPSEQGKFQQVDQSWRNV